MWRCIVNFVALKRSLLNRNNVFRGNLTLSNLKRWSALRKRIFRIRHDLCRVTCIRVSLCPVARHQAWARRTTRAKSQMHLDRKLASMYLVFVMILSSKICVNAVYISFFLHCFFLCCLFNFRSIGAFSLKLSNKFFLTKCATLKPEYAFSDKGRAYLELMTLHWVWNTFMLLWGCHTYDK